MKAIYESLGVYIEAKSHKSLTEKEAQEIQQFEIEFDSLSPKPRYYADKNQSLFFRVISIFERISSYENSVVCMLRKLDDNTLVGVWINSTKRVWLNNQKGVLYFAYGARLYPEYRSKNVPEKIVELLYAESNRGVDVEKEFIFTSASNEIRNIASTKMSLRTGYDIFAIRNAYLIHPSIFQFNQQDTLKQLPASKYLSNNELKEYWETSFSNGLLINLNEILNHGNHLGSIYLETGGSSINFTIWNMSYARLFKKSFHGSISQRVEEHSYYLLYNFIAKGENSSQVLEKAFLNLFGEERFKNSYFICHVWDVAENKRAIEWLTNHSIGNNRLVFVGKPYVTDSVPKANVQFPFPFLDPRDCSTSFAIDDSAYVYPNTSRL